MGAEPTQQPTGLPSALRQGLGVAVFLAGVVLLILVFCWAYGLYQGLSSETFGAAPATQAVSVPGSPTPLSPPAGTVKTDPGKSPPLLPLLATFGAKLITLVALGWLAGLMASKGAAMTRQVAPPPSS